MLLATLNLSLKQILTQFQFHGAPLAFTDVLSTFNLVFTLLFTVEAVFKLISFGFSVSESRMKIHYSVSHEFTGSQKLSVVTYFIINYSFSA